MACSAFLASPCQYFMLHMCLLAGCCQTWHKYCCDPHDPQHLCLCANRLVAAFAANVSTCNAFVCTCRSTHFQLWSPCYRFHRGIEPVTNKAASLCFSSRPTCLQGKPRSLFSPYRSARLVTKSQLACPQVKMIDQAALKPPRLSTLPCCTYVSKGCVCRLRRLEG